MKKRIFNSVALLLVLLLSFSVLSVKPSAVSVAPKKGYSVSPTIQSEAPDASKIIEARFLNMLNHSYVYNDAFDSVEEIVNSSVIALRLVAYIVLMIYMM